MAEDLTELQADVTRLRDEVTRLRGVITRNSARHRAELARLVEARDAAIHARHAAEQHADDLGGRLVARDSPCGRWPCGSATPITVRGDDGELTVSWPEGRPQVFPMTPELLESMIHTQNAYRCAERARHDTAWWAPWRWARR